MRLVPQGRLDWNSAFRCAIAVLLIGAAIVLQVIQGTLPDWLVGSVGVVIGFFFNGARLVGVDPTPASSFTLPPLD